MYPKIMYEKFNIPFSSDIKQFLIHAHKNLSLIATINAQILILKKQFDHF